MEPNRIENDFKNKLEQRIIKPSPMAWDRLDAMLSINEEEKKPKNRYWMYIAASFIGFLLIGAFILKFEGGMSPDEVTTTNAVVKANEPAKLNKAADKIELENAGQQVDAAPQLPVKADAVADNNTPEQRANTYEGRRDAVKDIIIVKSNQRDDAIAMQDARETPANESEELLTASLSQEQKSVKKSRFKVNANSLLSSVEGELDNSFRSEVLQKVVKNYNTVKSSVANRNYQ